MKRRSFLKTLLAGVAAIVCPIKPVPIDPVALDNLAKIMVAPIRQQLNYQAIGRKLLMVDELPQGAYARYEKDVRVVSWIKS